MSMAARATAPQGLSNKSLAELTEQAEPLAF
jgi:hypothetical protein